jgi:hypothetical protein
MNADSRTRTVRRIWRVRAHDATGQIRQTRMYAQETSAKRAAIKLVGFYPRVTLEQSEERVRFAEVVVIGGAS